MNCVFCQIVARQSPASFVYEDDLIAAFMTLQPTAPGECVIIPKAHIDHFTDLPDDVAQRIMLVAQQLGRRMRDAFPLERVGYLVHELWSGSRSLYSSAATGAASSHFHSLA